MKYIKNCACPRTLQNIKFKYSYDCILYTLEFSSYIYIYNLIIILFRQNKGYLSQLLPIYI